MTNKINEDISGLLEQINTHGKNAQLAKEELYRIIYEQMRLIANNLKGKDFNDLSIQPSGIIGEVYEKFEHGNVLEKAENRRFLFHAIHKQMYRTLLEHVRRKQTMKRGGHLQREPLDDVVEQIELDFGVEFEDLHSALEKLKADSERQYNVVQMKYFSGWSNQEISDQLGIARSTVCDDLNLAKGKLGTLLNL